MALLTPEIRSHIGTSDKPLTVEVSRRDIIKYSIATEQTREVYLRGDEAPPMFIFGLFRPLVTMDELKPDGLPKGSTLPELPLPRTMAGGTRLCIHRPMRPGDVLVGTSTIIDMFEKDGRQGPLIFVVSELRVTTEAGEPVLEETQTRIAR